MDVIIEIPIVVGSKNTEVYKSTRSPLTEKLVQQLKAKV